MDFDLDVFVSYAHLDDAVLGDEKKGWVGKLHETLEWRLAQLLGKPARIWRDPKLHGNDVFADALVERVHHAAVLVSVVSPRYVRSEWTSRELTEFCKAAEQQGGVQVHDKSRIFKVLKTPVPLDQQVPPLPSLLGYEFFKVDPGSGTFREFDEQFGPEYRQRFLMKLDDLAQDLKDLLEVVGRTDAPSPEAAGIHNTIYLATTTLDLQDQRDAIKRELQQHGYTVLPSRLLPLTGTDVDKAVREDLARCSMSIHLVGKTYSLTPEGAVTSLVELQNEWAVERAEQGGFTRLVWIPPALQVDDIRQQQVIDRLRADPRAAQASDLLETPLEDLRTVIYDTLERARPKPAPRESAERSAPSPSGVGHVYLLYDERDAGAIAPWADYLFDQGLEVVRPIFAGDEADIREYHEDNLRTADGVVIFVGAAGELWLRRKLSEVQKVAGYGRQKPAPAVVVCMLAPKTPEKEGFRTHEAVVVPQYDGLSQALWQPLLARVKG
ncbi:MAG TPA: TIR domain-containing protein [Vicinamibacterales bacterium]|nr:TIR domain-containing protein [Vicinamibacterales bacterium]